MSGIAIITEACIDVKDRACVDVCPVHCIFDPKNNVLFSEAEAGSGVIENSHVPNPDAIEVFGDSMLYVNTNTDECTSCTACYQPDVCPVGAVYSEEHVPDGSSRKNYNSGDPTNVALLLFSPEPRRKLPGACVAFARMPSVPGSRHSAARDDIEGDLVTVIEEADRLLYREMRKESVVVGLLREEVPEYPRPAVREVIVNAVAHRDYALEGAAVDIRVYDDRIEVQSPGGLPGHITVENMRHERFRRNPRLMEALRALRVVEDFGEGVDRMYREMEQRLLGPPRFEVTPASVTVTLTNRSLVSFEDLLWLDLLPGASRLGMEERRVLVLTRSGRPEAPIAGRPPAVAPGSGDDGGGEGPVPRSAGRCVRRPAPRGWDRGAGSTTRAGRRRRPPGPS